jgi:hypothetical protein
MKRIRISVGEIAINTPNYKSASFPKFTGHWQLLWITRKHVVGHKGGFSKFCANIKERCDTHQLHFATRRHNLVSFFGWIVFWQNCILVFYNAQTLYRMRSLCRSSIVIWSYSWIYEYYAGKHWMHYWMQENQTATYFLRSKPFSNAFNVYLHNIHIFMNMIIWQLMTYIVTSFGKAFAHVRNSLLKKAHVINTNIDQSYDWSLCAFKDIDVELTKPMIPSGNVSVIASTVLRSPPWLG